MTEPRQPRADRVKSRQLVKAHGPSSGGSQYRSVAP